MKLKFILTILFILPLYVLSQNFQTTWSQEIKIRKGSTSAIILLQDNTGIYCLMTFITRNEEPYEKLVKYDNQFNEVFNVSLAEDLSKLQYVSTITHANELYVFFEDDGRKETKVLYAKINKETGKLQNEPTEIFSADKSDNKQFKINWIKPVQDFFVISTFNTNAERATFDKNYYFDDKFKQAAVTTVYFDDVHRPFNFINRFFIGNGKSILVGREPQETGIYDKHKNMTYKDKLYTISVLDANEKVISAKNYLCLGDKKMSSCNVVKAGNNEVIISGFFRPNDDNNIDKEGIYLTRYNYKDDKIISCKMKYFSEKILKGKYKGGKTIPSKFKVNYAAINPFDNSFTIAAEFQKENTETGGTRSTYVPPGQFAQSTSYSKSTYEYDDIIVLTFDKNDSLRWTNLIPKKQIETFYVGTFTAGAESYASFFTSFPFYASYTVLHKGNMIYFLFNDNTSNTSAISQEPDEMNFKDYKKEGGLFSVSMDLNTGAMSKKLVTEFQDDQLILARYFYTTGNGVLFPTWNPRNAFSKTLFKILKVEAK